MRVTFKEKHPWSKFMRYYAPEWSNVRKEIYITNSSTSLTKQVLDYWVSIKGMYNGIGSLCLFSLNGYREKGKFMRIEAE